MVWVVSRIFKRIISAEGGRGLQKKQQAMLRDKSLRFACVGGLQLADEGLGGGGNEGG